MKLFTLILELVPGDERFCMMELAICVSEKTVQVYPSSITTFDVFFFHSKSGLSGTVLSDERVLTTWLLQVSPQDSVDRCYF